MSVRLGGKDSSIRGKKEKKMGNVDTARDTLPSGGERVFQVVCMILYDPAYVAVGTVPAAPLQHA